jgi:hypothetical protein
VYFDTPAINDDSVPAVTFVGNDFQVTNIYVIKMDKQFLNTLENCIIDCGAPRKVISDCVQVAISDRIVGILRTLCIRIWQR